MQRFTRLVLVLLLTVPVASCDLIGGIFKGGLFIGIIVAVIVVLLVLKLFGGRGKV